MLRYLCSIVFIVATIQAVQGESYEDKRCKCVCPSTAAVLNNTQSVNDRKLYIENVPPSQCNCDGVILPKVGNEIKGREQEFCPRCECKYEARNITIIKVVVIIVIWVIMLLVIYMGFLMCLDPLLNRRAKASYQEYTNDELEYMHNLHLYPRYLGYFVASIFAYILRPFALISFYKIRKAQMMTDLEAP